MANTLAPFGLSQYRGTGSSPTYEQVTAKIASTNSTAIFAGDLVAYVTGSTTGYIQQYSPGTTPVLGVFVGCHYLSVSQQRPIWRNYWPGSDANGDVEAYVITDPNAQFLIQTNTGSAVGIANIGKLATVAVGTGNTNNGISGMYLSTIGTTATYPLRIVDLYGQGQYGFSAGSPANVNGSDITTQYNYVVVALNNAMTRSNGAVTGIS
jgi:hypothetical protein